MSNIYLKQIILVLLSFWLGCIVLTDFVIIKTLFSEIDYFFKAGKIGLILFNKLNSIELCLASNIVIFQIIVSLRERKKIYSFLVVMLLYLISFFNYIYLTPKLSKLTYLWEKADLLGRIGIGGIKDIQQEHQFFHEIYIGLDSIKILLITSLIIISVWNLRYKNENLAEN